MITERRVIVALQAALIALFTILVVLQTLSLPGQWAHLAEENPDAAHLRWPLTAVSVFWVLCAQVVVVCTWRLLGLVRDDRIFTDSAMPWVDAIVSAIVAGWAVLVGVFLVVGFTADDPGLPLLLCLLVVGVAVIGLIVVVMRALLERATALRVDMEAVI